MPAALPQVAFFLLSLGILEGFFHVRNKEKKYLFVNFACFGVVKVAWFRLVEPEVSKDEQFGSKKILDVKYNIDNPWYFEA